MVLEAYSACPCGSGKKFKWCCQPFYSQIERAFAQDANGQHEAAEAAFDQLVQQFPDNAEVWGRRAELFWDHGKKDEAEAALDKALELNPRYANGLYLRGSFRHSEGEVEGALLLYRRAAELCDPEARELLADILVKIAQCELYRYRPAAARAALDAALRFDPVHQAGKEIEADFFSAESPYPSVVARRYAFKPAPAEASKETKDAFRQSQAAAQAGRFGDALKLCEKLAQAQPTSAPALWNLGLVRAWLGDNVGALAALDHYAAHEKAEADVADATALAEALRQSMGMGEHSDWTEHIASYRMEARDMERLIGYLKQERRLIEVQQHQGVLAGALLDRDLPPARDDLALFEAPRIGGHIVVAPGVVSLSHHDPQKLADTKARLEQQLGAALLPQPSREPRTMTFGQIAGALLPLRIPKLPDEQAKRLIDACLEQSFEHEWANRRLRSLGMRTPLEAMACAALRPRVLGLVKLLEEIAGKSQPFSYDFSRLRGLLEAVALDPAASPPPLAELDFPSLSWKPKKPLVECDVEELNALPVDEMSEAELQQALAAAQRRQHPRLIATFAEALLAKEPGQDRYPLHQALIQARLAENDPADALNWLNAGLQFDCEKNNGARRNDYELTRARIQLAANEGKAAYETYVRLIQRQPGNLEYLGTAAEAMLKAGLRPQAAQFAESGMAYAKSKGDKSRAGYFHELLSAARRG